VVQKHVAAQIERRNFSILLDNRGSNVFECGMITERDFAKDSDDAGDIRTIKTRSWKSCGEHDSLARSRHAEVSLLQAE
jgi:hypothetical protein